MWRMSQIRPLHKKGKMDEIVNYRPISNLQSISKLYKKLLLNKLDDILPNEEGNHQHGFRKNRGTTTALLEIQSTIAKGLDRGNFVAGYSIDMSAAFDLLRPHVYHGLDLIPHSLMNPLTDFLSQRKISVKYNNSVSQFEDINVGCVQGSVLGPKLFALYTRNLLQHLPSYCNITAYADDTYVCIEDNNQASLKDKIETTLALHENFLESIGMVVNKAKTELVIFNRKDPIEMKLKNGITSIKSIKALGVTLTYNLCWDEHISNMVSKTSKIISAIRYLRRWITQDAALQVVTSQYFGTCYYASPVWLNDQISHHSWKRLNSQHYRAIRAAVKDVKRRIPRVMLNIISKRATPRQWADYSIANAAINLINTSNTRIADELRANIYINDRLPRRGSFIDKSAYRVGRQSLTNRLQCLKKIDFDWIGIQNPDLIRKSLKKTFIQF